MVALHGTPDLSTFRKGATLRWGKSSGANLKADVYREYRALAVREGDVFYWFWIGHHDEYMRQLDLLC